MAYSVRRPFAPRARVVVGEPNWRLLAWTVIAERFPAGVRPAEPHHARGLPASTRDCRRWLSRAALSLAAGDAVRIASGPTSEQSTAPPYNRSRRPQPNLWAPRRPHRTPRPVPHLRGALEQTRTTEPMTPQQAHRQRSFSRYALPGDICIWRRRQALPLSERRQTAERLPSTR